MIVMATRWMPSVWGACEEDVNGNGVCDADEIMGCTVPEACNYEEDATKNDGSCDFLGV